MRIPLLMACFANLLWPRGAHAQIEAPRDSAQIEVGPVW